MISECALAIYGATDDVRVIYADECCTVVASPGGRIDVRSEHGTATISRHVPTDAIRAALAERERAGS